MLTCNESNRFLGKLLAGVMIGITVVLGSLYQAVASIQTFY
jgi:hypothetical protein